VTEIKYRSWPLGAVPESMQRPELAKLRELGYNWSDPRDAIDIFEKKVANYSGAKYGIAVDSCSNGLFLCLKYLNASGKVSIPRRTYVSVPMQIIHAGCRVKFDDREWSGAYQLKPYPIWDAATRFTREMYIGDGALHVVSFQLKKRVPIGRGGMILTNDKEAYRWLKLASYDGRDLNNSYMNDNFEILGWHMYMTPEDAARGILLMDQIPEVNEDSGCWKNYSDLSTKRIFE